jgi:ribosomal protein S14
MQKYYKAHRSKIRLYNFSKVYYTSLVWRSKQKMLPLLRRKSPVVFRQRCFVSGSTRSINSTFKLSRMTFRSFALSGLLPGVRKSS